MGARGRRGLIAGLKDLSEGVVLARQLERQRLADALERERLDLDWERLGGERAYRQGLLTEKRREGQASAKKAVEESRAKLMEGIQRGRISKNLERGDTARAARIAFNRGIALPEHTLGAFAKDDPESLTPFKLWLRDNPEGTYEQYVQAGWRPYKESGGAAGGVSSALNKARELRAATIGLAGDIAAEKPKALSLDKLVTANRMFQPLEPEAAPAERFLPEASRYTGASDLAMPKAPDPYAMMAQEEWEDYVAAQVRRYAGYDQDRINEMALDPSILDIMDAPPEARSVRAKDIQRLVGLPRR